MTAGKIGLVVITFERYFKVVHAIAHRKYYRNWMTWLGVALPWMSGISTFIIPASVSTRAVPGQCPLMGVWPSKNGEKVGRNLKAFNVRYIKSYLFIYLFNISDKYIQTRVQHKTGNKTTKQK